VKVFTPLFLKDHVSDSFKPLVLLTLLNSLCSESIKEEGRGEKRRMEKR
jgi:hypothetical protein